MYHKMKTIRSNNHQLGSYELNKVSLPCFDDKRRRVAWSFFQVRTSTYDLET